jgi:pyruvate/2-oxoglutarate dehydrogenase complex dihydrolipoamide dehydrogenase (E3) component
VPLLDVGTVAEIERGRIRIVGEVERVDGATVRFVGGDSDRFDAIVLATGYEPRLPDGIQWDGSSGVESDVPGLYFCGYYVAPTGMLREMGREARAIVNDILRGRTE